MSEVAGRTFLVTGGNTGIGRATVTALAQGGGRVYVASRSPRHPAVPSASAADRARARTPTGSVEH
jgi:NAD(P)-dependent dehydrogenase (short-subunit alcohol dehydrogenase family)